MKLRTRGYWGAGVGDVSEGQPNVRRAVCTTRAQRDDGLTAAVRLFLGAFLLVKFLSRGELLRYPISTIVLSALGGRLLN